MLTNPPVCKQLIAIVARHMKTLKIYPNIGNLIDPEPLITCRFTFLLVITSPVNLPIIKDFVLTYILIIGTMKNHTQSEMKISLEEIEKVSNT